jgi:uncharacterized membrane protein
VLFFFFGPGGIAGLLCFFAIRASYHRRAQQVPRLAIVVLIVLALISCYVGVVISFSKWGT